MTKISILKCFKIRQIDMPILMIQKEINANLKGIHPMYDATTMALSWYVDDLLSAIYFSIFI